MTRSHLPLFPLPVVLFPGTLIPLHIFEPRYRQMVDDTFSGDRRFGLLYHDPDEAGPFMNEPGRVGTVAEIRRRQGLPDGRSLILVRGVDRFQTVSEVDLGKPYYEAEVKGYSDHEPAEDVDIVARRKRSLTLFQTVLQTLPHVPDALPSFELERELSFKLAGMVRMDPFWQQELLEMKDEAARLTRLNPIIQAGLERWWADRGMDA